MENTTIAIIDADGLIYHSLRETFSESLLIFEEKLQNIFEQTKATHYVMFYSNGRYFRHWVDPEYKGNRKDKPIPKYLKAIKQWAIAEFNMQQMDNVEADDLCAYWTNYRFKLYTNRDGVNTILDVSSMEVAKEFAERDIIQSDVSTVLCSPDKDLLESIAGKHFNYSYMLTDEAKDAKKLNPDYVPTDEDIIKGEWVETDIADAQNFQLSQLIIGDAADNIKGIEGKGVKFWEKMYNSGEYNYDSILDEYFQKYGPSQGIYNFQKNYRTLHLLDCDEDFLREIGAVPEFPTISKVNPEEPEIKEDF